MASTKTRNFCKFSRAQDELLIENVSRHPALYDASTKSYKNTIIRENIWREIAKAMNKDVLDCKTRWRTLRDLYKRKIKIMQNQPSGLAAKASQSWEYINQLSFLQKVPTEERSFASVLFPESSTAETDEPNEVAEEAMQDAVEEETHYTDAPERADSWSAPKKLRRRKDQATDAFEDETPLMQQLIATLNTPEKHPVQTFFESMAQTVMTFPPRLAAEAKLRVCQIITELEYRAIELRLDTEHSGDSHT